MTNNIIDRLVYNDYWSLNTDCFMDNKALLLKNQEYQNKCIWFERCYSLTHIINFSFSQKGTLRKKQ